MPFVLHRKFPRALSLIHNMGDQAEVAFYEHIPRVQVALGCQVQIVLLLLPGQGPGEAAGGKLQSIQQAAEHQPGGCKHRHHLTALYSPRPVPILPFSIESSGQSVRQPAAGKFLMPGRLG